MEEVRVGWTSSIGDGKGKNCVLVEVTVPHFPPQCSSAVKVAVDIKSFNLDNSADVCQKSPPRSRFFKQEWYQNHLPTLKPNTETDFRKKSPPEILIS